MSPHGLNVRDRQTNRLTEKRNGASCSKATRHTITHNYGWVHTLCKQVYPVDLDKTLGPDVALNSATRHGHSLLRSLTIRNKDLEATGYKASFYLTGSDHSHKNAALNRGRVTVYWRSEVTHLQYLYQSSLDNVLQLGRQSDTLASSKWRISAEKYLLVNNVP